MLQGQEKRLTTKEEITERTNKQINERQNKQIKIQKNMM